MLPNYSVELPNFTLEEREDFLQILKLMRIGNSVTVTFVLRADHEADYEAMTVILSAFIDGRRTRT